MRRFKIFGRFYEMKTILKQDKYRRARGGHSRVLDLTCSKCATHVAYYQKDGPGILKRMYIDRIIDSKIGRGNLICPKCKELLGIPMVYKKESRSAIRLFEGAVSKKITTEKKVEKKVSGWRKRCQVLFLGLPRALMVEVKPSFVAILFTHPTAPYGELLFTEMRISFNSASSSEYLSLTHSR